MPAKYGKDMSSEWRREQTKRIYLEFADLSNNERYVIARSILMPDKFIRMRTDRIKKLTDILKRHIPNKQFVVWGMTRITNNETI